MIRQSIALREKKNSQNTAVFVTVKLCIQHVMKMIRSTVYEEFNWRLQNTLMNTPRKC